MQKGVLQLTGSLSQYHRKYIEKVRKICILILEFIPVDMYAGLSAEWSIEEVERYNYFGDLISM